METGSFTRAAELCGVSQPAVTKVIRSLERHLGGVLFHREGNRLILSELGRSMAPLLARIEEQASHAERVAESVRVLEKASVRVGVMETIGGGRIGRQLARFQRSHPGVTVELHQAPARAIVTRLDSAEFDLAITNAERLEGNGHHAEPLYRERYVAVFGRGHRFEALNAVTLADIVGEPYVDRVACELRKDLIALCQQEEIVLLPALRSDQEAWVQELLAAGCGFAILPEFSVCHPALITRPFTNPDVARDVSIVRARGRRLSSAARTLHDHLRRESA